LKSIVYATIFMSHETRALCALYNAWIHNIIIIIIIINNDRYYKSPLVESLFDSTLVY